MNFKKVLALIAVAMCGISLVGCSNTDNTGAGSTGSVSSTETDQQRLENVKNELSLEKEVSKNFTVTVRKNGVVIKWSSNNEAITFNGTDAIVKSVTEDVTVKVTAELSIGSLKDTKEFTVVVKAFQYDAISSLHANKVKDVETKISAVVVGTRKNKTTIDYIVADETGSVVVYDGNNVIPATTVVGDKLEITGKTALFKGAFQVNASEVKVISSGQQYPEGYIIKGKTLADFALLEGETVYTTEQTTALSSNTYELEGYIVKSSGTDYVNYYFQDALSDEKVSLSFYTTHSGSDYAYLDEYVGAKVKLNFTIFGSNSKNTSLRGTNCGDITVIEEASPAMEVNTATLKGDDVTGAVKIKATVSALTQRGFMITDSEGSAYVYATATDLKVGDVVLVEGTKDSYNNATRIANATYTILEGETAVMPEAVKYTEAEFLQYVDNSKTGTYVSFEATVKISGNYINFTVGGVEVRTSYPLASFNTLKAYDGLKVNVKGFLQGYKLTNDVVENVTIILDDASIYDYSDAEKVAIDKENLTIDTSITNDLDLPKTGLLESTITWAVTSGDAITISEDGVVTVNRPAAGQPNATVVLTATIKSGDVTETKEFTVTVEAEISLDEVQTVSFDFSAQGYTDQQEIKDVVIAEGFISANFDKGTGQNVPKYYGTEVRLYGGGVFTISSTSCNILSITINYSRESNTGVGVSQITTYKGEEVVENSVEELSTTSHKITVAGGDFTKFVLTNPATSGHYRFLSISIEYKAV